MHIIAHGEIPDDPGFRDQWNSLVSRMARPEIFYTYEWATAAAQSWPNRKPLLATAWNGENLVGLVALTSLGGTEACFLAGTTADYCDFISLDKDRWEFISLVLEELHKLGFTRLSLANLPCDSVTAEILNSKLPRNYMSFLRPAYRCSQVMLGNPRQRQMVREATTKRKSTRYSLRALARHGELEVEHLTSWGEVGGALPEFFQAHVERFESIGLTSHIKDPSRREFLTRLAERLCDQKWFRLSCLRAGELRVAWNYGFKFCGSWFYYQPTFDTDFEKFSPGVCLLSKIVEAACDDPAVRRVDLGLGGERYKERLENGCRQTLHATVTTSTTRRIKESLRYHATEAVKSSPYIERGIRKVLNRPAERVHG